MKILIAEKDHNGRDLLGNVLKAGGHEVLAAGDGEQAAFLLEHGRPDVVLMNLFRAVASGRAESGPASAGALTPVIFFASPAMADRLVELLESVPEGGCHGQTFDALPARAKIAAMERILTLCSDLGRCGSFAGRGKRGVVPEAGGHVGVCSAPPNLQPL